MSRWFGYGAELGSSQPSWEEEMRRRLSASGKTWQREELAIKVVSLPSYYLAEGVKSEAQIFVLHSFYKKKFNPQKIEFICFEADNINYYTEASFFEGHEIENVSFPLKDDINLTNDMWLSQTAAHLANALFALNKIRDLLIFSAFCPKSEFTEHLRRVIFSMYGEYPRQDIIKARSKTIVQKQFLEMGYEVFLS